MKRVFLSILFMLLIIPCFVSAKSYCNIVSGTGSSIGDEIKCGDENFYIIDNSSDNYKLLAKYNLKTGLDIERVDVTDEYASSGYDGDIMNYCDRKYPSPKAEKSRYSYIEGYSTNTNAYCRVGSYILSIGTQDIKAIGLHGTGIPDANEVGVVGMFEDYDNLINFGQVYNSGYTDGVVNPNYIQQSAFNVYAILDNYKMYLRNNGLDVKDINLITVKEISNVVKAATNKELPLTEWWNNGPSWTHHPFVYIGTVDVVGSIKDNLNGKFPWLYSTTYFTRTSVPEDEEFHYFVDTLGNLGNGLETTTVIGAGIRPVITINKADIVRYVIKTNIKAGKGKVEVVGTANGGDNIQFRVIPAKGYKLVSLTITTDTGEKITYRKVNSNTVFTMPSSNVLIETEFAKNPETVRQVPLIMLLVVLVAGLVFYRIQKPVLE